MRKKSIRLAYISVVSLISGIFLQFTYHPGEQVNYTDPKLPPYLIDTTAWVDSVFNELSLEEKIAQSICIPVYPQRGESEKEQILDFIKKDKVGGLIFFQGTPCQVSSWAKEFQAASEVPLLIAIDGEWGLDMRLDSSIQYPRQMMLGAIQDNELLFQMGKDIAKQLKHIGVHINFAPVADINNNPDNPVINSRSFGEIRENVSIKSNAYALGMQSERVMAVAKHFPGHGDTYKDSHRALPIINFNYQRLDSLEFYPFRYLINQGVGGIMMAHMNVKAIDSTPNLPTSLSSVAIDSLLRKELEFKGLVFTDAMNMQGVAGYFGPVDANLMAYLAGNDILLMPHEVRKSIKEIKKAVRKEQIAINQVNEKVKRILLAKEWCVNNDTIPTYNNDSLHKQEYYLNKKKLIEAAITVIENKDSILPIRAYDTLKVLSLSMGPIDGKVFQKRLQSYIDVDIIDLDAQSFSDILGIINNYNLVILSLHTDDYRASRKYGFSDMDIDKIQQIISQNNTILVSFAEPYFLNHINNLDESEAVVIANHKDSLTQNTVAQSLFGAYPINGKIPVSIQNKYIAGTGEEINALPVLTYTSPFEAGIIVDSLLKIDSIVNEAIRQEAMPGCQVLAARNGKVFFQKSYGYQTYRKKTAINDQTIYDIASVTKIAATLPVLMKLADDGQIDIRKPLSDYLPELDTTNKSEMLIEDILMHQAGLYPWIPFYQKMIEPIYPNQELFKSKYSWRYPIQIGKHVYMNKHIQTKEGYVTKQADSLHSIQVAEDVYISNEWFDTIFYNILSSEMREPGEYRYSDLGFILFYDMIKQQTGKKLEFIADSFLYSQIGAKTLGYHPLQRFPAKRIAPTENDLYFRKQVLQGYVHDPAAAMMGGASGHAGLFSTANDLAKLMQTYLNGGKYAGKEFINAETIEEYSECHNCKNGNRRGIGFDKPEPDTTKGNPCSKSTPLTAFGHTGFTGTAVWMEPETGILYIFLSNRVFPDVVDNKLSSLDVRTNIQEVLFKAVR